VSEESNGFIRRTGFGNAAGLVGFAVGTETGGSILYPAVRCGATGLRPTFAVSRDTGHDGAGSMDKSPVG